MSKDRDPEATCNTCPYWKYWADVPSQCRRHSPIVAGTSGHGFAMYPVTSSDMWCGEHPEFFLEEDRETPDA